MHLLAEQLQIGQTVIDDDGTPITIEAIDRGMMAVYLRDTNGITRYWANGASVQLVEPRGAAIADDVLSRVAEQENIGGALGAAGEDAPIDASLASWLQMVRDVVSLSNWDETDMISEWRGHDVEKVREILATSSADLDIESRDEINTALALLDRLEIREVPLYPFDAAQDHAAADALSMTEYGSRLAGEEQWMTAAVELVLSIGGPTVVAKLTFDDPDDVLSLTYTHSWGSGIGEADERTTDDAEVCKLLTTYLSILGYEADR